MAKALKAVVVTPALAQTDSTPAIPQAIDGTPPPRKEKYYRVRKHSVFLWDIVEVEVDETLNPPKTVSKQDCKELTLQRVLDFMCPHPDALRKLQNIKK